MTRARADAWTLRGVTALVTLFCVAGLYRVLAVFFLHVPLDPNEGWNAYHAAAAMMGAPLYPDAKEFFFNNYPPLSFYLVGALGRLMGDNIVAGRIVSLLAFAGASVLVAAIGLRMKVGVAASAIGSLFFASVLLLFSDYVGMDDPQLLGHALQLAALLLVLREPRRFEVVALAAFLLVSALFVKHNLIALPFAAATWLAITDRSAALKLGAAGAVVGGIGLILFRIGFGGALFGYLASSRTWAIASASRGIVGILPWATVPGVGVAWLLYSERSDRYVEFCAIYSGFALLIGSFASGGAGVDANAFFDLAIALSLSLSLLLQWIASHGLPVSPSALLVFLPMTLSLGEALDADWYTKDFWLHPWADEARAGEDDVAFLRAQKGDALCETLALCYWAGKRETVDVFNLGQAYATGARSDAALIKRVEHQDFAVIEYESVAPFQLTSGVLAATRRTYVEARNSDNGVFFVPRPLRR